MKIFYKLFGSKLQFLRTHCVHCGKHFWMTKKHFRMNLWDGVKYPYCMNCINRKKEREGK